MWFGDAELKLQATRSAALAGLREQLLGLAMRTLDLKLCVIELIFMLSFVEFDLISSRFEDQNKG